MKVTWEHIVDYARGLADVEVAKAIEADNSAMEKARSMRLVHEEAQNEAPEMWMQRAKALLVAETRTLPLLFGRLLPASSTPGAGFRSSSAAVLHRYEFDGASLELRIDEVGPDGKIQIIGVFEGETARAIRVGTPTAWVGQCDEDGQFAVLLDADQRIILFQDVESGQQYQVELPKTYE